MPDAWPTIALGKPSPHTEIVLRVPGFEPSESGPPTIRVGDYKEHQRSLTAH